MTHPPLKLRSSHLTIAILLWTFCDPVKAQVTKSCRDSITASHHIIVDIGDGITNEKVDVLVVDRNLYSVFHGFVPVRKPVYNVLPIPFNAPHYRLGTAPVHVRFDLVELKRGESFLALSARGHYNAGRAKIFFVTTSSRGKELWMFDGLHRGYPSRGKVLLARLKSFLPRGAKIVTMTAEEPRDEKNRQIVTFVLNSRSGIQRTVQIAVDTVIVDGKGELMSETRSSPGRGSWIEGILDYSMYAQLL